MKKMWLVVLVLLVSFSFAMAQEIHWANQITVTWDAPTLLVDGTPIPAEDVLAYNMYLKSEDETVEFIETVSTMPYTFTLQEGVYDPGVSALRYIGGAGEPFESDITWGSASDPPFLLGYGRATQAVTGLSVQ